MSRFTRSFAMLATALVASACSTDKVVGPVDPPLQVTSTLSITGADMVSGNNQQLRLIKSYSNGIVEDLTFQATWFETSPYVSLSEGGFGMVHAESLGVAEVTASFGGVTRSITISVIGTVGWADLPSISPEAKAWVKAYVLNPNGKLFRHSDGEKKVFVGTGYDTLDVRPALDLWSVGVGGKLTFSFTADSASSDIFLTTDMANSPAHSCGWGGPFRAGSNDIKQSAARICPGATGNRILIAHEIGHTLVFMGHVVGFGILGTEETSLALGSFLSEVAIWVYSVPSGIIPY